MTATITTASASATTAAIRATVPVWTAPDAFPCETGPATLGVAPNCQVEIEGSGKRKPAPLRRGAQPGPLFHPEGTLGLPGEELPHERVVRFEQLRCRARFDDPPLPQHRDV